MAAWLSAWAGGQLMARQHFSVEAERMFSTMTFIKPAEPADRPPQPVRTYLQPAHLHPS